MAPTNPNATGSPPVTSHQRHPLRGHHWKYATCAAPTLPHVLAQRESRGQSRRFNAALQSHGALLRRLAVDATLDSHRGCVNHLRWNEQGTLLASGSDDTRLILWDYATHRVRADIATGHVLNIFAVCFVPGTQDHILATGAMDKDVRIHYAPFRRDSTKRFRFHRGRVKDIASSPGVPRVFWSVGEDGVVFQFDLRSLPTADGMTADGDPSGALIRLGKGRHSGGTLRGMGMAVHPLDPTQVVVACGDFYTRLYDRRMLRVEPYRASHRAMTRAVEIFAPPHLHVDASCDARTQRRHDDAHGTSVQFSSDGTQVLANYHNDHIYLYNVGYRTPRVPEDEGKQPADSDSKGLKTMMVHPSSSVAVNVAKPSSPSSPMMQLPGARMDRSPPSTTLRADDVRTLFSQGVVELLAGRHASALSRFSAVASASCVDSMPASFRKDLYFHLAKAYLGRAWRADAFMAALHAKLALSIDDRPEREIEKTYVEALDAARRYRHVLYRAALYQTRYPQHQEDVEEMVKEAMARQATPARERHLRVYRRQRRRRSSSSSSSGSEINQEQVSDDSEEESDQDSDDDELHIEEEPVPSRTEDDNADEEDDNDVDDEEADALLVDDEDARYWRSSRREGCVVNCDPERRFIGYCNLQTDIKEASFFGPNDAYIVAGSDDGRAYIWDKHTGRVVNAIEADADIVNCVQPHPFDVCLATSGIENVVRLWKPTGDSSDELSRDELDELVAQNQSNMADSTSYYLAGANPNIIRLIFQSDQHEGVQECATS
ncbi:hypothetical protein P43SY_001091 [Pythium insidiosum]|uniref:WD40 repeat-like protein n=1 Tax=Pythium insidiosum TaxID=114742 RepID=A0AAD5M303_PYTIN|nr:hypothetical protein P43SY_001091 [Pythium insidiosum]